MNRRKFIELTWAAMAATQIGLSCNPSSPKKINGKIVGSSSATGHLLKQAINEPIKNYIEKEIVIIGAGVSGLSCARHLEKNNCKNFIVLELEPMAGGHSRSGSNDVSSFPWGAHYVPLPNNNLTEYLAFLSEAQVIKSFDKDNLPEYDEMHLCFDPQERLFVNGQWQEGLIPDFGVPETEKLEIKNFLEKMNGYRYAVGSDGKEAFAIPVFNSSKDEVFTQLDKLTMKDWMVLQNFTSSYLHEYVNYCCRDDFGTPHSVISAWAGIHYYASRKGKAANAIYTDVLTWPEGNDFLIQQVKKNFDEKIKCNALALKVQLLNQQVLIDYWDVIQKQKNQIKAKHCVLAIPQFVAARLLNDEERKRQVLQHLQYAPWVVANIKTKPFKERSGMGLCWDNVIHNSASLGYVNATHQMLAKPAKNNFTFYYPLTDSSPAEERKKASVKSFEDWSQLIVEELKNIHPDAAAFIEEMQVLLWGHAMPQPLPGLIYSGTLQKFSASIQNKIHFAHTDVAGVSIFEEGFYQGIGAAKKILKEMN